MFIQYLPDRMQHNVLLVSYEFYKKGTLCCITVAKSLWHILIDDLTSKIRPRRGISSKDTGPAKPDYSGMEFTAGIYTVCQPVSPVPPSTPPASYRDTLTTSDTVRSSLLKRHNRQCRAGGYIKWQRSQWPAPVLFYPVQVLISSIASWKRPGYYAWSNTLPSSSTLSINKKPLIPKRLVVPQLAAL